MKETPMQQLLNQLKEERSKLPLPAEWGRCYQAIEMVIETTYLPMERQEIIDTWNTSIIQFDNDMSAEQYYQETFKQKQ
jgi:hypothetical protein